MADAKPWWKSCISSVEVAAAAGGSWNMRCQYVGMITYSVQQTVAVLYQCYMPFLSSTGRGTVVAAACAICCCNACHHCYCGELCRATTIDHSLNLAESQAIARFECSQAIAKIECSMFAALRTCVVWLRSTSSSAALNASAIAPDALMVLPLGRVGPRTAVVTAPLLARCSCAACKHSKP